MTRNLNDIDKKNEIKQREERIKNRNKSKKEAEQVAARKALDNIN